MLYSQIGDSIDSSGNYVSGISGSLFAHELNYLAAQCDRINVRINSIGGSVLEGYSIVSAILNCSKPVYTYIDGLAASIAGVVAVSGKKCYMMDYGTLMLHNPSGGEDKKVLALVKETLVTILSGRTGKKEEEIYDMMSNETWLNASQAKEFGMIDEIVSSGKKIKISSSESLYNMTLVYNKLINNTMTEEQIQAIEAENATLKAETKSLRDELKSFKDAKDAADLAAKNALIQKATELVNKASEDGKIDKAEVDTYILNASQSENSFSFISNVISKLENKKISKKPFDIKNVKKESEPNDRSTWTYSDWQKKDMAGLANMLSENPEEYNELLKTRKIK